MPRPLLPHITAVEPHPDRTLTLTFEDGAVRRFDVSHLLDTEVFGPLRSDGEFFAVRIVRGSLEWPCGADLAYDALYERSEPVTEAA